MFKYLHEQLYIRLPNRIWTDKVTRTFDPTSPPAIILIWWIRSSVFAFVRVSSCRVLRPDQGQVNGQGHSEGLPQDHSYLDQSLSARNVPRYQPIAAILLRKPMPSKNIGHRGNINAPVSPFFPFLVRSLPTDHFFISSLLFGLALSRTPVDLLGPRIGPVLVRAPAFRRSIRRSSSPYFHCFLHSFLRSVSLLFFCPTFSLLLHVTLPHISCRCFTIRLAMRADVVQRYTACPY